MANLKDMKTEDILKEVMEKREALRAFRFGEAGTRTRNVREGRTLRKDIARLLTEVRARSIASQRSKE
jgi:ribosomal protein L29